ncbi:hypothetical protein H7Y63_02305 [Polaromonas sp.]|nr:hypothetical protein [Candidatus Saccharibacteria bacterium]
MSLMDDASKEIKDHKDEAMSLEEKMKHRREQQSDQQTNTQKDSQE